MSQNYRAPDPEVQSVLAELICSNKCWTCNTKLENVTSCPFEYFCTTCNANYYSCNDCECINNNPCSSMHEDFLFTGKTCSTMTCRNFICFKHWIKMETRTPFICRTCLLNLNI